MSERRFPLLMVLALVLGGCEQQGTEPGGAPAGEVVRPALSEALVAKNNLGVGQMGRFDYHTAAETFEAVVAAAPQWHTAQVNLAIAVLNRQQPGDEERALALVNGVLAEASDHPPAHYVAGVLEFNRGQIESAAGHFQQVLESDPDDAYAHYFLGQTRLQSGALEDALASMEQAIAADPYLRSAHYGAFLASQRLGQMDAARRHLSAYQRLEVNPRSRLAEIKYTRMGPKAEARAIRSAPSRPPAQPQAISLHRTVRPWHERPLAGPVLGGAVVMQADLQAVALTDADRVLQLFELDGTPRAAPFVGTDRVEAMAWGDYDNDGATDLYLAREGANELWRRQGDGRWEDVSAQAGVALAGHHVDVLFLDADHDGDLDLFLVRADGPDELLNNDGNGQFRPLSAQQGLEGPPASARVLAADIDRDRDLDLLVLGQEGTITYRNDRLWSYQAQSGPQLGTAAAVAVDLGADGVTELCALRDGDIRCLHQQADAWVPAESGSVDPSGATEMQMLDANGDGSWELLLAGEQQWQIVSAEPLGQRLITGEGRVLAVLYPEQGAGPALLVSRADGVHLLGPQAGPYLTLSFSGRDDSGEALRSNRSGLGTRYVVRAGEHWIAGLHLQYGSGRGNSLQSVAVGLGSEPAAQYIELDWPDGVFQTELQLEAGSHHHITETQRQLASCPVLFGWTADGFQFLSDVLGVGGIGFAIGPGEYARPRPREHFLIDAPLAPLDGHYRLNITEPMEETAYLDRVQLVAVDFPADFRVGIDERMATDGQDPSGELFFYRQLIQPGRVINDRGESMLDAITHKDEVAAEPGPADPRFPGLLAQEHHLELIFEQPIDALGETWLLMDGWVEYGYSQTSFAAWQSGITYQPPSLDAQDSSGAWRSVAMHFGYPAGMPRQAAWRLPDLPAGTRALRLRTNQLVYWDRLGIAVAEPVAARHHRLELTRARVEKIGFPQRTQAAQRRPHYEYSRRSAFWDTRYQSGFYTALGPATELVTQRDGAFAIIGPGDSLSLSFADRLPPRAPGWQRVFVARFDGYAKDMDLYTRDGETVGPLPDSDWRSQAANALHERYNSRFLSGR